MEKKGKEDDINSLYTDSVSPEVGILLSTMGEF